MRLIDLAVERFRNLEDARLPLASGTTVLLGDNGQGKTSFLEAVGALATTKSFRRARSPEMARHGTRSWRVRGIVESPPDARGQCARLELEVSHEDGRRITRAGGLPVDLAEYIGYLTVVAITQAHAGVIRGAPQERRDFLDRGILGVRPPYLRVLARYRRTLRQKNALLRAGVEGRDDELATWNERLAEDGADVTLARRLYVRELGEELAALAATFVPESEPLAMSMSDVMTKSAAASKSGGDFDRAAVVAALRERMTTQSAREIAFGQALVGPQRDELELTLAGRDIRRFASSGQQRNALLALKLAKVELFRHRRGETPVLLVDDVDTEIDRTRLLRFLEHVGGKAQSLLTSSKRDLFGSPPENALFYHVERGLLTGA